MTKIEWEIRKRTNGGIDIYKDGELCKSCDNPPDGILHVTAGTEEWEPTQEDLVALADMFMDAMDDPEGGIIATRQGVHCDYIRIK